MRFDINLQASFRKTLWLILRMDFIYLSEIVFINFRWLTLKVVSFILKIIKELWIHLDGSTVMFLIH